MADEKKLDETEQNTDEGRENDQELTFEHGYGAQEGVLSEDKSLEDVAGVSEKDIENDLLREQDAKTPGEQESHDK